MTKHTPAQEHPDGFDAWIIKAYTGCSNDPMFSLEKGDLRAAYTVGLAERVVVKDLVFKREQGFYIARPTITTTYKIEQKAGLWHLEINGFTFIGKKTKAEQIQNANAHHKAAVLSQIEKTP